MQSEELKRKAMAFDDMSPDESIGAFGGSGQWVELCTVRDLREFEAALSTDAEPVAWRYRAKDDDTWRDATLVEPSKDHKHIVSEPLYDLPQSLAPAVAVKALHQAATDFMHIFIQDGHLTVQGIEDIDLIPPYEKLSAALSAQAQDVATVTPSIDTMRDAAKEFILKNGWQTNHRLSRIRSTLFAQVQDVAIPEGWKLVPKEHTPEMEAAYRKAHGAKCVDIASSYPTEHPDDGGGPFGYGYRAMLAAAPAAKQGEAE